MEDRYGKVLMCPNILGKYGSAQTPITTAVDDNFDLNLYFREIKSWHFMWIVCLADDSHEISRLVFLWKKKKKKNRMASATNFAWRFKG